jgi:hypothetical protein
MTMTFGDVTIDEEDSGGKYHRVKVRDRKVEGQVRVDDPSIPEDLEGYKCYPQPDQPAADFYPAFNRWKRYLEKSFPKRGALASDDFLYPHVTVPKKNPSSGKVDAGRRMTGGDFQALLDLVVVGAKLGGYRRTGHCFRRGGAQDKYILCKKPWSLHAVKWWGGWGYGESSATILKYLMNIEWTAESYYGDMLNPSRNHQKNVFRGSETVEGSVSSVSAELRCAENRSTIRFDKLECMLEALVSQTKSITDMQKSISAELKTLRACFEYL